MLSIFCKQNNEYITKCVDVKIKNSIDAFPCYILTDNDIYNAVYNKETEIFDLCKLAVDGDIKIKNISGNWISLYVIFSKN
jgi:hypothetical protein